MNPSLDESSSVPPEEEEDLGVLIYHEYQRRKAEAEAAESPLRRSGRRKCVVHRLSPDETTKKHDNKVTRKENRKIRSADESTNNTAHTEKDVHKRHGKASPSERKRKSQLKEEGQTPTKKIDRKQKNGNTQVPRRCSYPGCKTGARAGGVCLRHGAKVKRCSYPGCTHHISNNGVCRKHGAKIILCRYEGCTSQARTKKGGVCFRHSENIKRCSYEGCTSHIVNRGVCQRHGAKVKSRK